MAVYLSKILLLLVFGLFIIFTYYFKFNHTENFDGYLIYVVLLSVSYMFYKAYKIFNSEGEKNIFSLPMIGGLFALHLAILSGMFFIYQKMSFLLGVSLFIKILGYLLLPILIVVISIGFGKKILSYIKGFGEQNNIFQFIFNLSIGFFSFISLITIIGFIGFYNSYSVLGVLLFMSVISFDKIIELGQGFIDYKITISSKEGYGFKLLSTEFLFIVSTFLLSVNLISAFRPFPIGWDDLGIYMNVPNLLAQAGELFSAGGMFSWQIFTGIGYIFNSPTQAFFLNNVGGILSFIVMILIFSDLFSSKSKKHFLPIPILLSTVFVAMPMFIFEQAKDMKLDPGFYFISISVLYITFKLLLGDAQESLKNKVFSFLGLGNTEISSKYIYYGFVGILLGFSFSIKFTGLLLIAGLFALIFFARLGLAGLFGYIGIFFSIFTKFGLWKIMGVSYPSNDIDFVNIFSLITFIIGGVLLGYSLLENKNIIQTFFTKITSVFLGIIIGLLPWFVFNLYSADQINISTLLSGKTEYLQVDYTQLYSQNELDKKKEEQKIYSLTSTGTTGNEDWGRYFGYEEGINNYVKLPWNLSMQRNQRGEFTDITYIYLALLPLLLLFLPYRSKFAVFGIIVLFIAELLLFVYPTTSIIFTQILSQYNLPRGYGILLLGFIVPLVFLLFTLKNTSKNKLLQYNLVFGFFYTFLWTIAAYGVVWYGIVMYFNLLLVIGVGIYYLGNYTSETSEKMKQTKMLGSIVVFMIIAIYFFASSFPHGFKNIQNAAYKEFKKGDIKSTEAPFLYHPDYLGILYELNISPDKQEDFIRESVNEEVLNIIGAINKNSKQNPVEGKYNVIDIYDISELTGALRNFRRNIQLQKYHNNISNSLNNLYFGISQPKEEFKNKKSIYRIGTFLKYYISENNKRLFEDSLVTQFKTYILGSTPDKTVDNMKKLGLNYFLVDLNAATIDNDPRRNLTKRYETLLKTFTSEKLELVSTDSKCFQVAREDYLKSKKTSEDLNRYLWIGGVNYDSFDGKGKRIPRGQKQLDCYNTILQLIEGGKVNGSDYNYLLPLQNYFIQNRDIQQNPEKIVATLKRMAPSGYKVLFKIKD